MLAFFRSNTFLLRCNYRFSPESLAPKWFILAFPLAFSTLAINLGFLAHGTLRLPRFGAVRLARKVFFPQCLFIQDGKVGTQRTAKFIEKVQNDDLFDGERDVCDLALDISNKATILLD